MEPFTLAWWQDKWETSVFIHDSALASHDYDVVVRYANLCDWIEDRIDKKYGEQCSIS